MPLKVLITDDELDNIDLLRKYLRELGERYGNISTLRATNGKQAVEIAQAEKPDLILLDWVMPVMNGITALELIKANPQTQDIPVVMVTARDQADEIAQAFEKGASDYVNKPIHKAVLLARVRSVLNFYFERKKNEELLYNILPKDIADEIKEYEKAEPRTHSMVSVLITDVKKFATLTKQVIPHARLIAELDYFFEQFDEIIEKFGLEKIKTKGDTYICAGGMPVANQTNPIDAVLAGLAIQRFVRERNRAKMESGDMEIEWNFNLGICTGEVTAGVIGKKRFSYDVWGETVNFADRIERTGQVGKVHIAGSTYQFVKDFFVCEQQGKELLGTTVLQRYEVKGINPDLSVNGYGTEPNDEFWLKYKQIQHPQQKPITPNTPEIPTNTNVGLIVNKELKIKLIEMVDNGKIFEVFQTLDDAKVTDLALANLKKKFVSGNIDFNFDDQLKLFISNL